MRPYSLDHYSAHERISDAFSKSVVKDPERRNARPYVNSCRPFVFRLPDRHPPQSDQGMVEVNGIEPMTSWLQTRRSPN